MAKETLLGMIPHKTYRGTEAMKRLKTFEGCPPPYDKKKKMVCPQALRHMCLKPRRKVWIYFSFTFESFCDFQYCKLGRLSAEVGWKYDGVIAKLEGKRKVKAKAYHVTKKKETVSGASTDILLLSFFQTARREAFKVAAKRIAPYQKIIESYGYT